MGRGNAAGPPGMSQPRIKPEGASLWGGAVRNGSWEESPAPGWDEAGPWQKQKPITSGPLWDNDMDWGHKPGPKQQLSKEMLWASKPFRYLAELGFKVLTL